MSTTTPNHGNTEPTVIQSATPAAPSTKEEEAPPSLFSMANLKVAQVHIIGGTLNGYSIGFVGVYSTLYGFSTNCADFKAKTGCETAPNADCQWYPGSDGGSYCGWPEVTCRVEYPTAGNAIEDARSRCLGDSRCKWSYSANECQNPFGYTPSNNGIFAGSMILGCLFGALFAGSLATTIGSKLSFILVGIVGIVASVMYHVSNAEDEFWVLVIGRFIIGLFLGVVNVACPMYVDQNAHKKYKRTIGVLFQVFTTLGIFLAAIIGLAVGQSVWFEKDKDHMILARMHGLCVFSTAIATLMLLMGIGVADSRATFDESGETKGSMMNANEYGWAQMMPRLGMGVVMAGTLQLTGINAVMNYAPTIMGSLGLAPLVGNFIVMLWNFVTTLVSIPLAARFTMRQLFLVGSCFTSCMCLFLCGIPVYPGVSPSKVKDGVAITGILLFIAGFEFCVAPCYYVLTQELYPPSFRPRGSSITQMAQFVFNVIINVCYPIATERISGGPSGNQDKGQAVAFIFFGCIGLLCFVFQVFFLHPWEEADEPSPAPVEPLDNKYAAHAALADG